MPPDSAAAVDTSDSSSGKPLSSLLSTRLQIALRGTDTTKSIRAQLHQITLETVRAHWKNTCTDHGVFDTSQLCLAATGSLARAESGPASDLDLVLLYDAGATDVAQVTTLADRLWYPIWDAGLRLDHAVRTPAECEKLAAQELSEAIGLLDLMPIAGQTSIADTVRSTALRQWRAMAGSFLPQIQTDIAERTHRWGEVAYALEPHLKAAQGGLRDMTLMRAIVASWLADRPHGDVDAAHQQLLTIRDALHATVGRNSDRLLLADYDAVAALLGYADADELASVLAHCGRVISHGLHTTLRAATTGVVATPSRRRPLIPRMLASRRAQQLNTAGDTAVQLDHELADPITGLRIAARACHSCEAISPATLANFSKALNNHPLPTPWPLPARQALVDILAGPEVVQVWESLDLAGIICQLIPAWSSVRNLPQRTPAHRFTVDRHQVQTVHELRDNLVNLYRPDIVLVAALLHDMGKAARQPHHAGRGARPARRLATELGFSETDAADIELLIREHLTLVDYATRRDPSDPQTITGLCQAIDGRPELLAALQALTCADAKAAGPTAWTPWRAQLVDELVAAAHRYLEKIAEPQQSSDNTAATEAIDELLGDAQQQALAGFSGSPHVVISPAGAVHKIITVTPDRHGLFADIAGVLAACRLSVMAAKIRTVPGPDGAMVAVDTWLVQAGGRGLPDSATLATHLRRIAAGDDSILQRLPQKKPAAVTIDHPATAGTPAPRTLVCPQASNRSSVIEVHVADAAGLLHTIGSALREANVNIRSAHVATYATVAIDTFYLTEPDGTPLSPARTAEIIATIHDALA